MGLLAALLAIPAYGADPIVLERLEVQSDWPNGARIELATSSQSEITAVVASVSSGLGAASVVRRPTITRGERVEAAFNVAPGYVPPFGEIVVQLSIENAAGEILRTEPRRIQYVDNRYAWEQASDGLVTAHWHGNVASRARAILAAATTTVDRLQREAGLAYDRPVKLVIYNTKDEIDSVIPFRSATSRRELITAGQAQAEHDLVLVLATTNAEATAAHELTHLVVMNAAQNPYFELPAWLNEGLAVYFQGDGGREYQQLFERRKREDRLLSLRAMTTPPGKPEDNLLMYGEGYELVRFLIGRYGPENIAAYLAAYREAKDHDTPLRSIYGFDRDQLEAEWRAAVGAPSQVPPSPSQPVGRLAATLPALLTAGAVALVLGIGLLVWRVVRRGRYL